MNRKKLKKAGLMFASAIIIISFVYGLNIQPVVFGTNFDFFFKNPFQNNSYQDLETFSDYEELRDFLKKNSYGSGYYYYGEADGNLSPKLRVTWGTSGAKSGSVPFSMDVSESTSNEGQTVDYSETNIQVEGVDEPDVIKTDGTYIYMLANQKVYIIKAYPSEEAALVSTIDLPSGFNVRDIFINADKLVVFGTSYRDFPLETQETKKQYVSYWWPHVSTTLINVYDVSDRADPEVEKEIELDGNYHDSRMIDNRIYIITTENTGSIYYATEDDEEILNVPQVTINDVTKKLPAGCINYIDTDEKISTMTNVISINLDDNEVAQESYMISNSQNMYVSKNNIYITYTHYDYIESPNPIIGSYYRDSIQTTVIHKISITNGEISYKSQGSVPGHVLNQFSMDEHNGYFRIATTVGNVWDTEEKSSNNVYILDEDLEKVSEVTEIAPGEKIYSARFMGDKAYLVTFKKVDPFFTLDLSDPENPKVLGKLKIPGYSDYLHPFDENHIIGIGKDTVEALSEQKEGRGLDFAWYQGIKIAIFDVSDFENPKELDKIVIGDRGTSSPALYDHKAFLFDREKELLVIPVSLCEISEAIKEQNDGYTGNTRGDFTFQGAYVYKLSLDGFEYRGRITHMDDEDLTKSGYYGYYGSKAVERSLFIGDVLYTISDSMLKLNSLDDLSEINSVELN